MWKAFMLMCRLYLQNIGALLPYILSSCYILLLFLSFSLLHWLQMQHLWAKCCGLVIIPTTIILPLIGLLNSILVLNKAVVRQLLLAGYCIILLLPDLLIMFSLIPYVQSFMS